MSKLSQWGIKAVAIVAILLIASAVGFAGWKAWEPKADGEQHVTQPDNRTDTKKPQNAKPENVATGTVITAGNSKFGTMLFNDKGQAIYIWELEESAKPECYGDCAEVWPPVLTNGAPQATGSVNKELLSTTERTDGSTQVTYNGHPLYYYAHEAAGEVKCHNVRTHGGLWWVIQPSGIRAD